MTSITANLRHVDGVLLLDKSLGCTSNQALQRVKHLFGAKKAGHTGSLDPMATGMLPLCFGHATKFAEYILLADKCYETVIQLGVITTTADAEGTILERRPVPAISNEQLESVLSRFRGSISQIPPMHSAIKVQGQPLYKLAHRGITVERQPRQVTIHGLLLLKRTHDQLELRIHCTKGTYIRTLAQDIGEQLGCGASIAQLRRIFVAPYERDAMFTLDELTATYRTQGLAGVDRHLLPIQSALARFPAVTISAADRFYLQTNKSLPISDNIRLLSKLAMPSGFGGDAEHRTAVYTPVHEDSSTASTLKAAGRVEFGKKSILASGLVRVISSGQFLGIGEIVSNKLIVRKIEFCPHSPQRVDS